MGKFLKALKKAEKENIAKPDQPLMNDPDAVSVDSKSFDKPDRGQSSQKADTKGTIHNQKPHTEDPLTVPLEPLLSTEKAPAQHVEQTSDLKPANLIARKTTEHTKDISEVFTKPESKPNPVDSEPGSETTRIPASSTEISNPQIISQEDTGKGYATPRRDMRTRTDVKKEKKLQVTYSNTKVQVNDPERLRNNKIISVFDDFETTEQIKILRTQVLKKLKKIGGNSVLVTSANQYEGKTFTSINLGVSIAKEFDRTVLIIDADIRKPTKRHTEFATQFFSLIVEKGLSDYLEGEADISEILINPGIEKLTLIPGGLPVNNSPELLNSDRMEQMMAEIKSRYPSDRIVIVDGPAILPFPDAMILSRYVDGILPVIEAERTSTEEIKKMMNLLKETTILGSVFNKSRG